MSNFLPPSNKEFDDSQAWGILTSVDLHGCDAALIRDASFIKKFTKELCKKIKVKTYGETQVILFGDDPKVHGFSMVQLIESSLVSAHFAEESNGVYLDIFSCKYYDPKSVISFSKKAFKAKRVIAHTILRGGKPVTTKRDLILRRRGIIIQSR